MFPPRCAWLGPGAGLGHLRPAAPLRRQQYVRAGGASTAGLTATRAIPEMLPPYFFFCTLRYAASLAVPFHINASAGDAAAIVLQWSPSPRAACPGMLVKYLICYAAEGDNVTCEWESPPSPWDNRRATGRGCQTIGRSLSFAQMVKQNLRRHTTPSKTYSLARSIGWAFRR